VGGPVNGKHPAAEQEPKDATGSDSGTGTAGLIGMALDGRRTTGAEPTLPKKLNQLLLEPGYIAFLNASPSIVVFQENVKQILYYIQIIDQFLFLNVWNLGLYEIVR